MTRCGVKVVVQLLDVFAVIALRVGQPEQPFLEDRVLAIPQCQRQANILMVIAESGDAVLTPTIGAAARLVVRQIFPSTSPGAVVLAYRPPLSLGEIRAPAAPVLLACFVVRQSLFLGGHRRSGFQRGVGRHAVSWFSSPACGQAR